MSVRIIVEECATYFVAYPIGLNGAVAGEGDTRDEAVFNLQSAIRAHISTFGKDAFLDEDAPKATYLESLAV